MKTEPFLEAARELRGRFFSLIDSLSALRGLTAIDIRHRPESDLLEDALEVLLRHQDLERCSIFLERDDRLECLAGRDWDDLFGCGVEGQDHRPATFPLGEGIMGEAARSAALIHCRDCSRDPRFKPLAMAAGDDAADEDPHEECAPSGALICAPITTRGEVLGVVNVYHPVANHFEPWHEHTLVLFCGVLGHMLDNNRLRRRMENAVEQRTRQLETALCEAEQLKRRYEELSNVDELTTLHNRRFFFPEAQNVLAHSTRYGNAFSLMLIDVDQFKQINDRHGHAVGDAVLKDIADTLETQTREVDILARFGGEEFVIALPSTDLAGARLLAERIRGEIATLRWCAEHEFSVSISAGLATLDERRGESRSLLETLLREGDRAMYEAKSRGRDRVVAFIDLPATGVARRRSRR